jgi:hypothetical protein
LPTRCAAVPIARVSRRGPDVAAGHRVSEGAELRVGGAPAIAQRHLAGVELPERLVVAAGLGEEAEEEPSRFLGRRFGVEHPAEEDDGGLCVALVRCRAGEG